MVRPHVIHLISISPLPVRRKDQPHKLIQINKKAGSISIYIYIYINGIWTKSKIWPCRLDSNKWRRSVWEELKFSLGIINILRLFGVFTFILMSIVHILTSLSSVFMNGFLLKNFQSSLMSWLYSFSSLS